MQTVWSRATQARLICNCPSCITTTTSTLTRRATTATARQRVRVGDVFTVLSSSLAAVLAVADSRSKDARRRQWDKVINEARASVEATESQQQNRLAALNKGGVLKNADFSGYKSSQSGVNGKKDTCTDQAFNWLNVFEWARKQEQEREASAFQKWKGLSLSFLMGLSEDQLRKLRHERLLRHFYGGPNSNSLVDEPFSYGLTTKKLVTLEWSVATMVLRFLLHCSNNCTEIEGDGEQPTNPASTSRPAEARLRRLRAEIAWANVQLSSLYPLPHREHDNHETFQRPQLPQYSLRTEETCLETVDMNMSLQRLLSLLKRDTESTRFKELMLNICRHLLTARTPANTCTYNLLLVTFCWLKQDYIVHAVLGSMRESHIRPNEITHVTVLEYYTKTGNEIGFKDYLARMNGLHGGIASERPRRKIDPLVKGCYHTLGKSNHKLAKKARMNAQVYESLIAGAFKYLSCRSAIYWYQKMISEGWKPTVNLFTSLLRICCRKHKWTVGTVMWEQLSALGWKPDTKAFEVMLRLCFRCGQQEAFDQVYREMISEGLKPTMQFYMVILDYCGKIRWWSSGLAIWNQLSALGWCTNIRVYKLMLILCDACQQQEAFDKILQDGLDCGALPATIKSANAKPKTILYKIREAEAFY